jgi:hypothetical protein
VLRIRDVYPRSRIKKFRIPDKKIPDPGSGSASRNLSILNSKNCFYALGNMFIPDPDKDFFTHPGFRGQKDTRFQIPDPDPQH